VTTRGLETVARDVEACRACPRLVTWRETVAREKTARFADQTYWGKPVPGFGDAAARVLVLGLAPAAHGGNRTGRIFTGDRSGDFLFGSLYREASRTGRTAWRSAMGWRCPASTSRP
jgi:uracil-DNA glycosylase